MTLIPASQILGARVKSRGGALALPSPRCRLAFCIALALGHFSAFAADIASPPTDPVKGRAPTASTPVFVNKSVPGKNPAIDDQIEASYTFADVDGDTEDPSNGVFQWKADASNIANATTKTFVPTAAQLKKFLTFEATPGTNPLTTDPDRAATAVTSPPSGAPVLPSRAQLAAAFSNSTTGMRWGDAYMQCASWGYRLPSVSELQGLFTTYTRANAVGEDSKGDIENTYGWSSNRHWASNSTSEGAHSGVNLHTKGENASLSNANNLAFACAKSGSTEGLPSITEASVPSAAVGTPVTATYTYSGNTTIPDRSRFQWYTATSATGEGKVIATGPGATTQTYTPVEADGGKFLMVDITPASYDTVEGTMVSATGTQTVSGIQITGLYIEKPTADRASFQANYTVTGGTEADVTYQWYWRGEKLVGATSKTYAFPTLVIPSATTAEELKVEVAPRAQRSGIRRRAQTEAATPVSATLALKSSIAWNIASSGQSQWFDMAKSCANQSNGNKRPGTTAELQALVASLGNMEAYGVNTANSYWTGSLGSTQGRHYVVSLRSGASSNGTANIDTNMRGLCVAGTAPAAPAFGGQLANGHTFSGTTFPKTGYSEANGYSQPYFEFTGLTGKKNWAYRSTDNSKADVYNQNDWRGRVILKSKGSANIEVYNVAGGNPNIYTINPSKWFIAGNSAPGIPDGNQTQNAQRCVDVFNARQPSRDEFVPASGSGSRGTGSLYGEWGNVSGPMGTTGGNGNTWSSSSNYVVNLGTGTYSKDNPGDVNHTVCVK